MPIPTPRFAIAAAVIAVALMAYPGRELGSTWLLLIVVNAVLVLAAVIDSLLAVKHSSIAVERLSAAATTPSRPAGGCSRVSSPGSASACAPPPSPSAM